MVTEVKTSAFHCEVCDKVYDFETLAIDCEESCRKRSDIYERLIEGFKTNKFIKFPTNCGIKIFPVYDVSRMGVDRADSDYFYTPEWFNNWFEFIDVEQAVAEGWRPFDVRLFKENLPKLWYRYVEAIKAIPHDQLAVEFADRVTLD